MKRLTPMRAIRAKCLDCCCQQPSEVRRCHIESCALWAYRMGKRPKASAPPSNGVHPKNSTLGMGFHQGAAL